MTRLAILWHMHQPYYEDLATGEHILPWVRLHAIKDYVGMVALLEEFPGVTVTFNLVPSLLVQVAAFAENRADDRLLRIGLMPAEELTRDDKRFLVANGFHVPVDRMIRPYARYAELHAKRGTPETFSLDDLRDLQVWHKLVWMDPDWLTNDPRLTELVRKGRGFEDADKRQLRDVELELLRQVVPAYRSAAARGQIELSTSPFYHPILPLVCDTDVHHRVQPQTTMPRGLFAWPSDAREQVRRARQFHRELFGLPADGLWPSEGALSDQVCALLAEEGVRWTATDEEILSRSLGERVTARMLYRPYEVVSAAPLRCLFRDHDLSDRIGFVYQSWEAGRAADDFLAGVRSAAKRFDEDPPAANHEPIVTVILDGENAWEHYEGGGRPFLRALYGRLQTARDIETVTMAAAATQRAGRLASLAPGSWINGDFYVWAGHADDHRAWAQLAAARRRYEELADAVPDEARRRAHEEVLIAEGSDWFWWYGDDHSSEQDAEFDDLFRRHLRNAYVALGVRPPDDLHVSNITTGAARGRMTPRAFASPTIDGEAGFGEWRDATRIATGGGAMHRVTDRVVRELRVAVDRGTLYLMADGPELAGRLRDGMALTLLVTDPHQVRVEFHSATPGIRLAVGQVVEVAIPFSRLRSQAGDRLRFSLLVTDPSGAVVEHHPPAPIALDVPGRHLESVNWTV